MRIGVIGPTDPDSFADNISSALADMGHDVVVLGPAMPRGRSNRTVLAMHLLTQLVTVTEAYQRRLINDVRRRRPELIICVHAALLPSTVASLHRLGCRVAFWFPDHVGNIDRQLMLACDYDAIFFKDRLLVERLQGLTLAPVHYLPEACNPAWHRPSSRDALRSVVVLAGNLHPERVLLLDRLHRAGVPLELHSSGYPRWLRGIGVQQLPVLPPVRRHEKARVFRNAAAVLNNLHPAEMDGVNCRLFEAAGCGGVVLCEDRPVLGTMFARGEEVLAFSTFDELVDHARSVLADPERGTMIGDAAARRAHGEHTYQHRLTEMLAILGGAPTSKG